MAEAEPDEQPEEEDPPAATQSRTPIALDGADIVHQQWSASVDGFSLRLSWVDVSLLGQIGDRVARPGLYFAAFDVEVANPLDDRAAPGVADGIVLQVALDEGPEGCPDGAASGSASDGSPWCLLPSTVEPDLAGDFTAGESRMVRVITEDPLHSTDIITDRLAVAATADDGPVLLQLVKHGPVDSPDTDGGEGLRGTLQVDGEPIEGVRVVIADEERGLIGEAISDADGVWEVATGGPGEFLAMLDQRTLPDGVQLRDETRNELRFSIDAEQISTALFALD